MTAVSISEDCCIAYLLRLDSILCDNILCDTGDLHIATVDSTLHKFVLRLLCDNFYLCPRHIHYAALILCDARFNLFGFVKPAKRSASSELRPRIVFTLFGKHKFQVYLVFGIVLNKDSEIGAFAKEVLEIIADLDNLIYRIFQFCFP